MNRESFERQHGGDWKRFEEILDRLETAEEKRPVRPGGKLMGAGDFPELYRRTCHHLALARHRLYGTDLEQKLNRLALRGHYFLYRRPGPGWDQVAEFLRYGLPRQIRREARLFLLCFALLFLPLVATATAVTYRPELAGSLIGEEAAAEYQKMYDPSKRPERSAGSDVMMFGLYVYNNIGIAFRTFAGGILFGVGSIVILLLNGVMIGAVAGHVTAQGFGGTFYPFVVGHSSFELLAIVLAGMGGLKLGLALVAPGRRRRSDALRLAGREAVTLIYGAAFLLLLAAFVEAFWSSARFLPDAVKYAAGALGWAAMAGYFSFVGRGDGA